MGYRYSRCKPSVEHISLPTVDDKRINCQVTNARGSCATALKSTFHSCVTPGYKVTLHSQDSNVSEKYLDKVLRTKGYIYQL